MNDAEPLLDEHGEPLTPDDQRWLHDVAGLVDPETAVRYVQRSLPAYVVDVLRQGPIPRDGNNHEHDCRACEALHLAPDENTSALALMAWHQGWDHYWPDEQEKIGKTELCYDRCKVLYAAAEALDA